MLFLSKILTTYSINSRCTEQMKGVASFIQYFGISVYELCLGKPGTRGCKIMLSLPSFLHIFPNIMIQTKMKQRFDSLLSIRFSLV